MAVVLQTMYIFVTNNAAFFMQLNNSPFENVENVFSFILHFYGK